jgi:pyruvate-formate lyase
VEALNVIHHMHDRYAYERIEMALHDYPVHRFLATVCRWPPTASRRSGTAA